MVVDSVCASVFRTSSRWPDYDTGGLARRTASALLVAFARLYMRGMVPKDIKPANVLFDLGTGEVRLMGFGTASRQSAFSRRARRSPPGLPTWRPSRAARGPIPLFYPLQEPPNRRPRSTDPTSSDVLRSADGRSACRHVSGKNRHAPGRTPHGPQNFSARLRRLCVHGRVRRGSASPRIVFLNPGESVERGTGPYWRMVAQFMAVTSGCFARPRRWRTASTPPTTSSSSTKRWPPSRCSRCWRSKASRYRSTVA
jgi:serine/threonine protein kinase